MTGAELYARGARTLLASWEQYARGARAAGLVRLTGAAAAVFPLCPEGGVYNNALLARGLPAAACARVIARTEKTYAAARVSRFAAWVHESDDAMRSELERRGYSVDTATHFMAMALGEGDPPRREVAVGRVSFAEHIRLIGLQPGFLSGLDDRAFEVVAAQLHGENASTAIAFDHDGDCGIFNVGTRASARRHGLASAVTASLLRHAVGRGCRTASLQATAMAHGLYAELGFRDLGRIIEYVQPAGA